MQERLETGSGSMTGIVLLAVTKSSA